MTRRLIFLGGSVLLFFLDKTLEVCTKILGKRPRPHTTVLLYHNVSKAQRQPFSWQMRTLKRLTTPIALDGRGGSRAKGRSVALTFDDGYTDLLANALPELQKHRIPATLFVPAGLLAAFPKWLSQGVLEEKGLSCDARILSVKQLRALPRDLINIGSHCMTHIDLSTLEDAQIDRELRESKQYLEKALGYEIPLVAFPYSNYTQRIAELAHLAGYRCGYAGHNRVPLRTLPSAYIQQRVSVSASDWKVEFLLKIVGAYRFRHWASSLKAALLGKRLRRPRKIMTVDARTCQYETGLHKDGGALCDTEATLLRAASVKTRKES